MRRNIVITVTISLAFLAFGTIFWQSYLRFGEACRDFGLSVACYFCELFGVEYSFAPTVTEYSAVLQWEILLPSDFASFTDAAGNLLIAYPAEKLVVDAAWKNGFSPIRHTDVYTKPGKPCRRQLLSFAMGMPKFGRDSLYIEDENGHYTPEYVALTKEFYIKL